MVNVKFSLDALEVLQSDLIATLNRQLQSADEVGIP
jgi:hypothetical protein